MNTTRRSWMGRLAVLIAGIPFIGRAWPTPETRNQFFTVKSTTFSYTREEVVRLAKCYKIHPSAGAHRVSRSIIAFIDESKRKDIVRWFEIAEAIHAVHSGKDAPLYTTIPCVKEWILEGLAEK